MPNSPDQPQPQAEPVILDRSRHCLSRRNIDPDALKVLYRLHRHGFLAYLVGGAVRDLLLGKTPQDFDVGTDARPRQVKRLFRNAYLIGRRFRLAQVRFRGGKIIEVATFRRDPDPEETGPVKDTEKDTTQELEADIEEAGAVRAAKPAPDRTFGSPREDALRRDITINALFYDIGTFSVIDFVGGLEDLAQKKIRVIGDPGQRYVEDPVRMWRVLRHAARLGFILEENTEQAFAGHRHLLASCSGARLYEELNKDLKSGASKVLFELTRQEDLLAFIFGRIGEFYQADSEAFERLSHRLGTLDLMVSRGTPLTQAEMYGLLLWNWAESQLTEASGDKAKHLHDAFDGSRMAVTLPRALTANIIQTLVIVERLLAALNTGRMRRSLRQRAHYPEASRLSALFIRGEISEDRDPFDVLFRQKFGHGPSPERNKKRRKRRRKKQAEDQISENQE